jgi:hypothetical protein
MDDILSRRYVGYRKRPPYGKTFEGGEAAESGKAEAFDSFSANFKSPAFSARAFFCQEPCAMSKPISFAEAMSS